MPGTQYPTDAEGMNVPAKQLKISFPGIILQHTQSPKQLVCLFLSTVYFLHISISFHNVHPYLGI